LRPKREEREEQRGDRDEPSDRSDRPRREDRFRRDFEPRGSRDRDRDRDRGGRDRQDRVGDGLRTGAFDKLRDLDLENR
jgi:hypothetical protein